MFNFILIFTLCSIFFGLDAKFDTLQEWSTECFKKYREYDVPSDFSEPNKALTAMDFNEIIDTFNNTFNGTFNPETKKPRYNIVADQSKAYVEKIKVDPGSKICFIGDIHGSLHSLLRCLLRLVALGYLKNDFSIPSNKKFYMVFTGDYVDRGRYGFEVIYTLLKLKLRNMDNVFLVRGNHETPSVYNRYGFGGKETPWGLKEPGEIAKKGTADSANKFKEFCNLLPLAVFIGSGQDTSTLTWICCCHGAIPPNFNDHFEAFINKPIDINKIELFNDPTSVTNSDVTHFQWAYFFDLNNRKYIEEQQILHTSFDIDFNNLPIKTIFRGHQHSFYGLKIGGSTPPNDKYMITHWKEFEKNTLNLPEKAKEPDGFKISEISYPVFTFSTASEGIMLPFDCFGILTTAGKWEDWRLLPFEFDLPASRNEQYVKITNFENKPANLVDPIVCTWVPEAEAKNPSFDPVPMDLFLKSNIEALKTDLMQLKQKLSLLNQKLSNLGKSFKI